MDKSFTETPQVLLECSTHWILDKPSGWLVHPQRGVDALAMTDWVAQNLGQGRSFPVHRLDRGTSGIMVWAKNSESARYWQQAWQAGAVRKGYLALVRGRLIDEHFVDHPVPGDEGAARKPAQSKILPIESITATPRPLSLVEVEPYTGRFHQIRRHVKHLGHPLIGDSNYGRTELNRAFRDSVGLSRLALHAAWLSLPSPDNGEVSVVHYASLPASLQSPLCKLGFSPRSLSKDAFKLFLKARVHQAVE